VEYPDYFLFGKVIRAHGIKGELRIYLDVDDITYYQDLALNQLWFPEKGNILRPMELEAIQFIPNVNEAIIQLKNIHSRTDAERWCGKSFYLPDDLLPELDDDDFYYHDIIGFHVKDHLLGELGTLDNFMEMPAQDLLVVSYQDRELLIPVVDAFIAEVNFDTRTVHTSLPEGYLDLFN
jgi:16S rRNA processing protein RimM